jgi:hypothetical protein
MLKYSLTRKDFQKIIKKKRREESTWPKEISKSFLLLIIAFSLFIICFVFF